MEIRKINVNRILIIFLLTHIVIWTLIPSISNDNLPLDVIEAIVWSDGWPMGWDKHPPLSSWFPGFFFIIFGNQDWSYYLLSQLFVVSAFIIIFKFSEDFFKNRNLSLISILLLEGIYFYNFTTPEFNVNVCQLPFWALTVYYCWKGIKHNDYNSWLLFGLFAALGVLSKYLFIYLLFAIDIFFIYLIINKKINFKCLVSLISFFIILTPHLIWLVDNNYTTITYGLGRTGIENSNFLVSHFLNPPVFLFKQFGILIPFFIMCFLLISKYKNKIKINFKDKKLMFLIAINFIPLILMFLTSLIMGAKIRTMWMTPFYLFWGVLFVYLFQEKIILRKLKNFFTVFLFLFILSPSVYLYISITQENKRTDYPGKKISLKVQEKWNNNFIDEISLVGGDIWHGGNLTYNLDPRPKWDNILEDRKLPIKDIKGGFVLIGDSEILFKICSGVFFEVENQGICMIGKKK
tara:strand:+ start:194 stop:1582 length:1389 start_codon:yes stop_codon:yes gene_type:complete